MNKFELYSMIFYVLDAEWEESHDEKLGDFLSGANPFLFADIGSAVPEVYTRFCEAIPENITVENSYALAIKYIDGLQETYLTKAFKSIDREEWIESVYDYLSRPHKGK